VNQITDERTQLAVNPEIQLKERINSVQKIIYFTNFAVM
jgi:hypothetical protein